MPEAPVPGQTVGQSNPAQPAGYDPPATPGPQDHATPSMVSVDSSGGWGPQGPIPSTSGYTVPIAFPAPSTADGWTAVGAQTGRPDQGWGVTVVPGDQAPPNTQPGLSGGAPPPGIPGVVPTGREAQIGQRTTGTQSPAGTAPVIAGPVGGSPSQGVWAGRQPIVAQPAGPVSDLWLEGSQYPPAQAPPNGVPGGGYVGEPGFYQQVFPAIDPKPYLTLRPIRINIVAGQATGLLVGGAGRVVYAFVKETTGSTAGSVTLWDGTPATGGLVLPFTLQAGQSARDNFYPHGIPFTGDLWMSADSGSVAGAIFVVPEDSFIQVERLAERLGRGGFIDGWQN